MSRKQGRNRRVTLSLVGFASTMKVEKIPYCDTGYFSRIICDYLDQKEALRPYYNRFPDVESFADQIKEKSAAYSDTHREVLVKSLTSQYRECKPTKATAKNIQALASSNTFTVVTGHQLSLFTGPLYFIYKILSVINLCEQLKKAYPSNDFVPVYWMATEDHDFVEINHFNLHGKNIVWHTEASGAVGDLSTEGLDQIGKTFELELGLSQSARELAVLFRAAYLEHKNLAAATRHLVNSIFGTYGLVILDGDDPDLKELARPQVLKDIYEQVPFDNVNQTTSEWQSKNLDYKVQVNPRPVNFFFLQEGIRERIEQVNGTYKVLNTEINFTKEALQEALEKHPERFSPNVLMRPVYQEVILPNLCYIGGGGEVAYWLQLKTSFDAMNVPFPIVLLRNSVLLMSEKQHRKMKKLGLQLSDLFLEKHRFINKKVREISNIDIDLSEQKEHLRVQFKTLRELAKETDASFLGAVNAQEQKQINGLEYLEKRLLKAQKRKLKDQVIRMTNLQYELFPNGSLQERQVNFSEYYLEMGEDFIPELKKNLDPLDLRFTVLRY